MKKRARTPRMEERVIAARHAAPGSLEAQWAELWAKAGHMVIGLAGTPPSVSRPVRAGDEYFKAVEGGVIKANTPTAGLLVATATGEVFVPMSEVKAALSMLAE